MSEAGLSLETAMRRGWFVVFVGGVVDADDVDVDAADAAAAEMREVTAEKLVRRVVVRVEEAGVIIVEGSVIALVFCVLVLFCSVSGY